MRDIQQQTVLGVQQRLNTVRHTIEGAPQFSQLVTPAGGGARGKIATAETFHSALQLAHGIGQVISQEVTKKDAGGHHPPMLRRQEPIAQPNMRNYENEPILTVCRVASDHRAAHPESRKTGLFAGLAEQAGFIRAGKKIASGWAG
jgi:hypothetical protein